MDADTTVFVIDEDAGTRDTICDLVHTMNLRVASYGSGQEFLEAYDPSLPGCLVSEVRIPGINGLQLQKCLADRGITLPMVFVSAHADISIAVRSIRAGAVHFLEKPVRADELWDAIQEAILLDQALRQSRQRYQSQRECLSRLTPKERHVLDMVVKGKKNRTIASSLGISIRTVELHRAKLMKKLRVRSLTELLRFALSVCEPVSEEESLLPMGAGTRAVLSARSTAILQGRADQPPEPANLETVAVWE